MLDLLHGVTPTRRTTSSSRPSRSCWSCCRDLNAGRRSTTSSSNRSAQSASVQGICTAKDWPTTERLRRLPRRLQRAPRRASTNICRSRSIADAAREAAALGLTLLRLAARRRRRLRATQRRAQGKLDFDDLLARAHRLLTDPENAALRERLADRPAAAAGRRIPRHRPAAGRSRQGTLRRRLRRRPAVLRRRLQAIDLPLPRRRAGRVPQPARAKSPSRADCRSRVNFRSQPAILHFVNALFCDAFARRQYEPLQPSRQQTTDAARRRIPVDDHARQEQPTQTGAVAGSPPRRKPPQSPAGCAS